MKSNKLWRPLIFTLLIGGLLLGIYQCGPPERSGIEEVITRYNQALIDAYLRQDTSLLERFTSPRERDRVQQYIFYLMKKNRIIRCYPREVSFVSVDIQDGSAIARTRERWSYEYLDARTKERLQPAEEISYEGSYTMKKQDSSWILEHLEVKEIKDAPKDIKR